MSIMEFSIGLLVGLFIGVIVGTILKTCKDCPEKIDITPEELEQARAILEREKAENIQLQLEANEIMKGFKN